MAEVQLGLQQPSVLVVHLNGLEHVPEETDVPPGRIIGLFVKVKDMLVPEFVIAVQEKVEPLLPSLPELGSNSCK